MSNDSEHPLCAGEGMPETSGGQQTADASGSKGDNIDRLRHQSSQKLKSAWEAIFVKFENAHLQAQDDIYLGQRKVKGDRMRIIRDRGHLRSLHKTSLGFGCFHIDKAELIGCEEVDASGHLDGTVRRESDCPNEEHKSGVVMQTGKGTSQALVEDPDLREFLQAEARRKEICGCSDSEEEDDVFGGDGIVDFTRPQWDSERSRGKSEPDQGNSLEVYSLALGQWDEEVGCGDDKKEGVKQGTALDAASSPPDIVGNQSPSTWPVAYHARPMSQSPLLKTPQRDADSGREGQSESRKRKRERVLLPRWEQSPRSLQSSGACEGPGKCPKSLCMSCGGFQKGRAEK